MSNFYILSHIIFLLIVFAWYVNTQKKLGLGTLACLLYLISSLVGYFYYINNAYEYDKISLTAFAYFDILLLLTLIPLFKYDSRNISSLSTLTHNTMDIIAVVFICLFIPAILIQIPTLVNDYQSSMINEMYFAEKYQDKTDISSMQTGNSLANIPSVLRYAFSEIVVFFCFLYLALPKKKKLLVVGLIISSLFALTDGIANASRTSMTWWLFNVGICCLIFLPYYSRKIRKGIILVTSAFISVMAIAFIIITASRFNVGAEEYAEESIVDYVGQSTINFNQYVLENNIYQKGDNTAPFFRQVLGLERSRNIQERQQKWGRLMKIKQGVFYSFIGDLCFDYGIILTPIILIMSSLLILKVSKPYNSKIKSYQLFAIYFWACICCNGVFYFPYKTIGGNLKIIVTIFFYCMLRSIPNNMVIVKQIDK